MPAVGRFGLPFAPPAETLPATLPAATLDTLETADDSQGEKRRPSTDPADTPPASSPVDLTEPDDAPDTTLDGPGDRPQVVLPSLGE